MSNEFVTLLEDAGKKVESFFSKVLPVAVDAAKDAEPIIDLAFPGIAILFNSTVSEVANAEATGQAASASGGNGAQKLASVLSAIEPLAVAYLQANGVTANTAQITAWVNAIVAALNALPAASTTPAAASTSTTTVGASTVTVTEGQ